MCKDMHRKLINIYTAFNNKRLLYIRGGNINEITPAGKYTLYKKYYFPQTDNSAEGASAAASLRN